MFFLGVLSVLHVVFLPGYCLLKLFRLGGAMATLPLAFGLSQIFNYFAVQSLHYLGLYQRGVALSIIATEAALALWFARSRLLSPITSHAPVLASAAGRLANLALSERGVTRVAIVGATIGAVSCFAFFVVLAILEQGQVFRSNDAINSWNEWAREWFSGNFTLARTFYPHLLPINWSITYKIIGTADIEVFAKSVTPLYAPMMMLTLFSEAIRRNDAAWLVASFFLGAVIPSVFSWHFLYGYADIPTAFFGLAGLVLVAGLGSERPPGDAKRLCLAAFFFSGAALCKQSGLVYVVFVLAAALVAKRLAPSLTFRSRLASILIVLALVGPPYLTRAIAVSRQVAVDPNPVIQNYVVGLGFPMGIDFYYREGVAQRVNFALSQIVYPGTFEKLSKDSGSEIVRAGVNALRSLYQIGLAAVVILLLAAASSLPLGGLIVGFGLGYFAFWSIQWGYDVRNLSPALAFFAVATVLGAQRVLAFTRARLR